jgi:spoIIIJ-associated protein
MQDTEKIKKIAEEFFKKMTFEGQVEVSTEENETVSLNLKIDDPSVLIGERGQTLADIQHLLKMIIRKQIESPIYVDVDIQNYKKKKSEYLKETARIIANEVSLSRKEKILDPMTPYERRIIHAELAERSDVTTESMGEGDDRRVVIKPTL